MVLDFEHQTESILDERKLEKIYSYKNALIFGGGESGDWVRSLLESKGISPRCYIDNYKPKQGKIKNGLMVLSFEEAILKYKKASICIGSLWADEIIRQIEEYDQRMLDKTIDFRGAMVWEIKEKIFQSYEGAHIADKKADYLKLMDRLDDTESRRVLEGLLNYRLTRNGNYLRNIVSEEQEYIDRTIVPDFLFSYTGGEIVDGGAFDGDTVSTLLNKFKTKDLTIHCYEPSKENANRIKEKRNDHSNVNIVVHESALQASAGKGMLKGDGLGSTVKGLSVSKDCQDAVVLECIDDVEWKNLRLVKPDIEGAERNALAGGIKSIQKFRPVLAICAYHRQDDLLALGRFISELENYKIYLRHYMNATSETIIYGIPNELC